MSEDDHVVEPPAGHLDLAGTPIVLHYGTVMALRDYMIAVEPSLKDDIDHFIEQARQLRRRYLKAIESDPGDACRELDIQTGRLKSVTISALAKGILDELKEQRERRFSWQQLVGGAVLSAFLVWLVTFLAVRGG